MFLHMCLRHHSPPAKLIDCRNFYLDFSSRKLLNIGLDPTDKFNTVIHIITPSRFVNISADFLKLTISSILNQGENVLVIESKIQDGCRIRILLNRSDLLKLQDLEWSIFETIERKPKSLNRSYTAN
ncbi:Uncharacterized protein FWK35_00037222 [Aphis craccivora]|uniref:Uncharacterized protein n=1 Tax=Aphis craccivora TaxID=307492 RepID=A0A6G0VKU7_APHCR|nr:Uncharacterized protein FWK35_00037222 [Aphis craccivora]